MEVPSKQKRKRENRSVLYVVTGVVSVVGLAAVILVIKFKGSSKDKVCLSQGCAQASVFFLDIIDADRDPCEDFYGYCCGGYDGHSTLQSAQHLVNKMLRTYIAEPAKQRDSTSVRLQKRYYAACMDLPGIERDANRSFKRILRALGGWPALEQTWNETSFDWGRIVADCIENGLYYDWFLYVENESLYNQSNEDLHIKPPDTVNKITPAIKESYILLMENVLNALGDQKELSSLSENIKGVIKFENELHEIVERSKQQDPEELYTLDQLPRDFPFMPWSSLLKNVVWANNSKIIFNVRNYLEKFHKLLNKTPKRVQANYIFWKLTESMQSFLSETVREEFQNFEELRGNPVERDRAKYCYGVTSTVFAYVSEAEYARRRLSARQPVRDMIGNIEEVLSDHIDNSTWMNSSHKAYAKRKLRGMKLVIGAPDEMFDEGRFDRLLGLDEIDILEMGNTLDVVRAVDKSRDAYNLDLSRSKISIQRINFYHGVGSLQAIKYLPDENLMFLPAAAFVSPIYSVNQPHYANYGALGTIIGHELVHGFGIMDSVHYESGAKVTNWSNATLSDFFRATECLLNDCNELGDDKKTNVSCQATFEENFADYAGINLAYEAYGRLDGTQEGRLPGLRLNPRQLFWASYASTMCYNDQVGQNANLTDNFTHMLPEQRIMGSFRNSEHFGRDFGCKVGSNMNPAGKCKAL